MKPETWAYIVVSLLVAFLGLWGVIRTQSNKRLKRKLRRALLDNIAFHEVEELLCSEISRQANLITPGSTWSVTGVKRYYRAQLRDAGKRTPSGYATPLRLAEDLESEGLEP